MIGHRRHGDLRFDAGQAFQTGRDPFGAAPKFLLHPFIRLAEQPVDRGDHADDLLLGYLHAAPDPVERVVVGRRRRNKIFPAQQ